MKNWIKASTLAATVTLATMLTPTVSAQEAPCINGCDVGEGLTATYSTNNNTLTVAGTGTLDRDLWLPIKNKYADSHIVFSGGPNSHISLPEDSESLFAELKSTISLPDNLDTSHVISMKSLFRYSYEVNPNVTYWDTSNVRSMRSMFYNAQAATPNVTNWDTGNVEDMSSLFHFAIAANPNVSNWDTHNVRNMSLMFSSTHVATPDTSNWDTSSVEDFHAMFLGSRKANPDTSHWNTSNAKYIDEMFLDAGAANPDVTHWDTSQVQTAERMFAYSDTADPDISGWNLNKAANTKAMFCKNTVAKQWKSTEIGKREATGKCMTRLEGPITVNKQNYELHKDDVVTVSSTVDNPEDYTFTWTINGMPSNETGPSVSVNMFASLINVEYEATHKTEEKSYFARAEVQTEADDTGDDKSTNSKPGENEDGTSTTTHQTNPNSNTQTKPTNTILIASIVVSVLAILGFGAALALGLIPAL